MITVTHTAYTAEMFYDRGAHIIINSTRQVGTALAVICLAAAGSLPQSKVQGGTKIHEAHGQVHQHGLTFPCLQPVMCHVAIRSET